MNQNFQIVFTILPHINSLVTHGLNISLCYCRIFEAGDCEMYVEIILIRLSQFLSLPSPHAPLNRLSLHADGALYLQFKYIDFPDKFLDTKYSAVILEHCSDILFLIMFQMI